MSYAAAVIIPTRGGASKLHYPLDALEAQTDKNFQVIVVIDGDIDGSAQVVQSYIDRGKLNLSMIVFEENQGRVSALNAGHRAADADILIRCDDDLQPAPHYIERNLAHHTEGNKGVIGIYLNQFPSTPYSRAYGEYRDRKFRETAYATPADSRWHYWAGNVSMTRELFMELGGYDEAYKLYGWEDVDMGYRIWKSGAEIIIDQELATPHYVAATTTAGRARRALYSGAAKQIFVSKHGEEVLPPLNPTGAWGLAVKGLSYLLNDRTIKFLGEGADKVVDKLPRKIAEKLIALLVESASYAGQEHPQRAQAKF